MYTLPAFTFPAPLAEIFARLPQQPPAFALVTALNLGLDRVIPRETLAPLNGQALRMKVKDAGLDLAFRMENGRFKVDSHSAPPVLTISATVRDFIALALREEDPDTLFFSRRLVMEGETDLGLLVKNTLDAVDWDAFIQKIPPLALAVRCFKNPAQPNASTS